MLCTYVQVDSQYTKYISLFYVFNLEYNKNTKDICLFFQEFVFGLPHSGKKSSTYLSVTTDIQGFALH